MGVRGSYETDVLLDDNTPVLQLLCKRRDF